MEYKEKTHINYLCGCINEIGLKKGGVFWESITNLKKCRNHG